MTLCENDTAPAGLLTPPLRAVGRFADEIDAVRETVPHTMLEDAGITPEALDALTETADGAVDARARTTRPSPRSRRPSRSPTHARRRPPPRPQSPPSPAPKPPVA